MKRNAGNISIFLLAISLVFAGCHAVHHAASGGRPMESRYGSVATNLPSGFEGKASPGAYSIYVDSSEQKRNAITIRSASPGKYDYGSVQRTIDPARFLGKKIRYTAMVRTANVTDWAGLSLSIDGELIPVKGKQIKGTNAWMKYDIEVSVPKEASELSYGISLGGNGQVWIADMNIDPL